MGCLHQMTRILAGSFLLSVILNGASAAQPGTTAAGIAYVSGGIGQGERLSLETEKNKYRFWLRTAAKKSGAYLSGVRVQIVDSQAKSSVLDHTMDGPWLFVALPPGHYEVTATYRENPDKPLQTLKKTTSIGAKDHRQMILYFDSNEIVGSDNGTAADRQSQKGQKGMK